MRQLLAFSLAAIGLAVAASASASTGAFPPAATIPADAVRALPAAVFVTAERSAPLPRPSEPAGRRPAADNGGTFPGKAPALQRGRVSAPARRG